MSILILATYLECPEEGDSRYCKYINQLVLTQICGTRIIETSTVNTDNVRHFHRQRIIIVDFFLENKKWHRPSQR
jgi:hypothetical protein